MPVRTSARWSGPVHLDGTGSVLGGGIEAFAWSWAGGRADGPTVDLDLPAGTHAITLTITGTDAAGAPATASDVVAVQVDPSTLTDPTSTTPPSTADPVDPGPTPIPPHGGCGCASPGPIGAPLLWIMGIGMCRARGRGRR